MGEQESKSLKIVSYGGSYLGRRANNEDSLGRTIPRDPAVLADKGRLYVVCDGMGGTKGGEVASQLAVETVIDRYYALKGENEACLQTAIREASYVISSRAEESVGLSDMGSTVVALVILNNRYIHAHVGDSRIYLLRDEDVWRLTRDHLHILEELGLSESEAETHPHKNILSRALGYVDASEPESATMASRPGDRLLLCTDGLSDAITQEQIQAAMELETPQEAVETLLTLAERNDAHDNSTALVIFLNGTEREEEPTERIPGELLFT